MAHLHYGDQEARRQAADVDHYDTMKIQGEGYCVQEHHGRNDPFTADKESPTDVSAGYGNQGDARKASPTSDYDHVTMPKDDGYTSLGFKESQDDNNSENSLGVPSEEGTSMKNREGSPPNESMAKELEDHSATEGGIIDVHSLKKDLVDLSERNTDELGRERECSPNGILGITEEQEEREGAPQGSYKDEQEEREGAPHESSMAKKVEGGSAVGGGIIDVQSLKEDYVNFSEGNTNEPKVDDASHADISQFTSQIQSAIDDPKRRYSVDDPKQEFPMDDSSKQVRVSDIMEEEQARGFDSKEHHDEHKEPFTEHVSSEVEQDAVFKLDSNNRDEDASERENAKNVPAANEESRYTKFNRIDDYVKAAYGAEDFVPKWNEDVDKELREPTERVYQEEQRRPTDENPLAKQEGNEEMASSEDAYETKEGNVKGIAHGKDDDDNINNKEIDNIDVPKRPPSLPHPQPEDLAEEAFNNKNNISEDDGHQNHEEPHKKGVFEKIKEKLTPHFTSN